MLFGASRRGGLFGTGLGLGDPQLMPAAHTDLILATLGEEWGFAGLFCVLALYAGLVWLESEPHSAPALITASSSHWD